MAPAICSGDLVLFRMTGTGIRIRRDSIVLLHEGPGLVVKRAVALPGDSLIFQRPILLLNHRPQNERFACYSGDDQARISVDVKVPRDTLYVLGDNRDGSVDSRAYGPVPIGQLRGMFEVDLSRFRGSRCLCGA